MAHLIDKSALVAEIEKWISGWTERLNNTNPSNPSFFEGGIEVGKHILSFLDTLDTKEVDLEKELNDFIEEQKAWVKDDWVVEYDNGVPFNHIYDLEPVAKHFFELGLKAQKGK